MSDDQNVPASKTLGFCDTLRLMPSGRRKQGGLDQRDVPSADKARSGYRHRVDLTPPYSEKAFNSSIRLNGNRPGVFLPKTAGKSRFACFPVLFVFRPFRALCFSVSAFCFCRLLFSSGHMHRFEAHGGGDLKTVSVISAGICREKRGRILKYGLFQAGNGLDLHSTKSLCFIRS